MFFRTNKLSIKLRICWAIVPKVPPGVLFQALVIFLSEKANSFPTSDHCIEMLTLLVGKSLNLKFQLCFHYDHKDYYFFII